MDLSNFKHLRFFRLHLNSLACKFLALFVMALFLTTFLLPGSFEFRTIQLKNLVVSHALGSSRNNGSFPFDWEDRISNLKFLEVPQIVWGLNNQKIAFARACLTARMMNRTLLMPSLSASLFYKEVDLLQPISFDKVFQFEKFNSLCKGFVQLGRYSDLQNETSVFELQKGSGRKWTVQRDLGQLRQFSGDQYDQYETIRIVGKNPFLWHDHWPVKDYAKVLECLALVDEISKEADKVVSKIKEVGRNNGGFMAVHMRVEKDWMIHCKKLEQRANVTDICSSKDEIVKRVGEIRGLKTPTVVYLAVADALLEDGSILTGWGDGLIPVEKKKLGVAGIYKKHPYLIQSAIDYEVCLRANVFVGNSYSTFSSLLVLERTQRMIKMGVSKPCGMDVRWPSYAYNLKGEYEGPRPWMTNMSDSTLRALSYGSNDISC